MFRVNKSYRAIVSLIIFLLLSQAAVAQKKSKKEQPRGKPVLWEAVSIAERDLLLGPGGEEMRPDLSRITFIEEEKGGFSTKYRIRDGAGRVWVAKVGKEAQSETAAVRLVWALGYKSEINYLVPELNIPGKGVFNNVRLEARPSNVKRGDEWEWKRNPFTGTIQLQGLKVMMAFLNNWDLKTANNKILAVDNGGGAVELHYIVSDLGATFGKIGNLPVLWSLKRSRNEPGDYAEAKFIDGVERGRVKFSYGGKMREMFDEISVREALWITNLLSQLTERQIGDAFRAANYSPVEVEVLTDTVRARINDLKRATASAGDSNREMQAGNQE